MLKILFVEDDKTIVANLTEYLNGAGYIVRSVSGQNVTLARLAAFRASQNSFCHIPYINKIIPAAHGKGQLTGEKGLCH